MVVMWGDSGLYEVEIDDDYWEDNKKFAAYFIKVDGNLAGFAMIADGAYEDEGKNDYTIDEFFIMYKYRRMGIGKKATFEVLDKHRGSWQFTYHPNNVTSVNFWERVINEYTGGKYEIIKSHPHPDHLYEGGIAGDVMYFNNKQ